MTTRSAARAVVPPAPPVSAGTGDASPLPERLPTSAALDGVRAVAVLMVFVSHTTHHAVLGYVGVDLFFVLSGFLITRVLLHEQLLRGHVRLRRFFANRALRLYPALLFFLALTVVPAVMVGEGWWLIAVRSVQGALYLQDLVEVGVVGPPADVDVHQHLWSLAVEEQFYLVWPLVLLGLARTTRTQRLACLAALLVVAEVLRHVVAAAYDFHTNYFFLTGHLDALLLGALGAALVLQWRATVWAVPWPLAVPAALGLLMAAWALPEPRAWCLDAGVGLALDVAALAVVLHVVGRPLGALARCLGAGPLRWLGRRSYGFYLLHLVVLRPLGYLGLDGGMRMAVGLLLSLLLVEYSWRRVELPFLTRKR